MLVKVKGIKKNLRENIEVQWYKMCLMLKKGTLYVKNNIIGNMFKYLHLIVKKSL